MSTFEDLGIQKEVQLTQGTLQYRECGTGTPIVFIHGLLVNGDLWRKVVPTLAKNYRCIIPDLPLGAHSTPLKADADLTPPGIAKLIANFLEALDLSSVTLVANDTGGAFSQIAITEYPERIGRLVLTDCDAYDNFLPPLLRPLEWLAFIPGFLSLLGQASKSARVGRLLLSTVAKHPVEDRALRSYTQPLITNKQVQRDLGKVLRGISPRYTNIAATKFSSFDKSVLIVWASEDSLFPKKYAERLQQAFPHATLHYIEDSYAFISEDQPEQLGQHIETFIESSTHQLTNQQREVQ